MTERLGDDMPAKIWVVPSDEKSGEYDVNRFCECLDCQLCRTTQRYVHTDLYTAACAEREALRALCEGMAGALENAKHRLEGAGMLGGMTDPVAYQLAAYEKHKGEGDG